MAIEKQKLLYTFLNVVWFITLQSLCTITMVIMWPLAFYSKLEHHEMFFPWNIRLMSFVGYFAIVFISSTSLSTTIYEHVKYEDIEEVLTNVSIDIINIFTILHSIWLKKNVFK